MMTQEKDILEGEIVDPAKKPTTTSHRQRYQTYAHTTRSISFPVFILNITALLLSLLPVIGLILSAVAFISSKITKTNTVVAMIAVAISSFSTAVFLFLVFIIGIFI